MRAWGLQGGGDMRSGTRAKRKEGERGTGGGRSGEAAGTARKLLECIMPFYIFTYSILSS